jgi:tyrosine decarboxylase/aspartate 1-decarboxylase
MEHWHQLLGDNLEEHGLSEQEVLAELDHVYNSDHHFNDGRILSSMCTAPHQLAIDVHTKFIEANLGNPDLYPGTKRLEKLVIKSLGDLFNGHKLTGHMTSGGTESNITALWVSRKLSGRREVLFPKNIHFSVLKAIDMLGMEPIEIELDETYRMSVDDVESKLTDKTAAVVAMAGATELGVTDPIEKLSELCAGKIFLHVDAAFGGFVIPFMKELGHELPKFDFELPGVSSLTVDPHKMGLSTIPAGALLYREKDYLDKITVDAPYLFSAKHSTLFGTRNSGSVAATYAVLRHLGRQGFKAVVKKCMENTRYLADKLTELGLELVLEPVINVVAINLAHPEKVVTELAKQNWFVSRGRFPPCLRFVLMPHITSEAIDKFMPVLESTCRALGEL